MKATRISGNEIEKKDWNLWVQQSNEGSFYLLHEYMSIIAPDWQAIVVKENEIVVAAMPFEMKKKMGVTYSFQPVFSQSWGVFFIPQKFKNRYQEFTWKEKVLKEIISEIPPQIKIAGWGFHHNFDYAIPFHQAKFSIQTRYTYQLQLELENEKLLKNCRDSLRRDITKSADAFQFSNSYSKEKVNLLIKQNQEAGKQILENRWVPTLHAIGQAIHKSEMGFSLKMEDNEGNFQGLALVGKVKNTAHYLFAATLPQAKPATSSVLLWNAILKSKTDCNVFDFEGSMLPGVESFFRAFGGTPIPYLYIGRNALSLPLRWKTNSL